MRLTLLLDSGEIIDPAPLSKISVNTIDQHTVTYRFKVKWSKVDDGISVSMNDSAEFVLSTDAPTRNLDGRKWSDGGPVTADYCYVDTIGVTYVIFETYKMGADDNHVHDVIEADSDDS